MTEYNIKNMRAFKIKYLGATNTKGSRIKYLGATNTKVSRIKIIDCRFNKSKTILRNYEHVSGKWDAVEYLTKLGIKIKFSAELNESEDIILTDNFEKQIDGKMVLIILKNCKEEHMKSRWIK